MLNVSDAAFGIFPEQNISHRSARLLKGKCSNGLAVMTLLLNGAHFFVLQLVNRTTVVEQ